MLLYRSASLLPPYELLSPPKLLSQFRHAHSFLFNPSRSSSSLHFWLNPPRRRPSRAFATAAVAERKGTDTFYADEDVSWISLGVSERLSRALYNAGIDRPSLTQVHPRYTHSWVELSQKCSKKREKKKNENVDQQYTCEGSVWISLCNY
jgi:hypothetical protein